MERAPTWCLGGHGFDSCQGHSCCLLRGLLSMDNCELLEIFLSKLQYHSNVSYHFSSRFSRDAYRFSRDEFRFSRGASRFSRESLKHLVWNIINMYYSQNVKNGWFHTGSKGVLFDGMRFQQHDCMFTVRSRAVI